MWCLTFMVVERSCVTQTLKVLRIFDHGSVQNIQMSMIHDVLEDDQSIKVKCIKGSFDVLVCETASANLLSSRLDLNWVSGHQRGLSTSIFCWGNAGVESPRSTVVFRSQ